MSPFANHGGNYDIKRTKSIRERGKKEIYIDKKENRFLIVLRIRDRFSIIDVKGRLTVFCNHSDSIYVSVFDIMRFNISIILVIEQ